MNDERQGRLVLVATPIGNLEDMSPRAARTIAEADAVMAEDTRRTGRFVTSRERLYSYHEHNTAGRLPQILEFLRSGETVALVSDAGMPGISDPAFRAVRMAVDEGFIIEVIPGPSAVITALAGSGLATNRFSFEGFLPAKKGARRRRLEEMSDYRGSLIFFTGPHHLLRDLGEIREHLGERPACVARELTKIHEEYARGTLSELAERFSKVRIRGEMTLVIGGSGTLVPPPEFD